jgi:hypothetical protein
VATRTIQRRDVDGQRVRLRLSPIIAGRLVASPFDWAVQVSAGRRQADAFELPAAFARLICRR